jgi:antirestriction protein ArdC
VFGGVPLARFYYCFNVAQCEGLKNDPTVGSSLTAPTKPEEIMANMPQRPAIKYGMRAAYYSPAEDVIGMPDRERFTDAGGFYSALYHEAIHSTGSKSRLKRPTLTESEGFGSNPYCKEELIAEMGAAFLCGQAGIEETTLENSAAYLQNWLKQLQNDKKLIVQAAAQAQRAADFILGVKHEEVPAEHRETATV